MNPFAAASLIILVWNVSFSQVVDSERQIRRLEISGSYHTENAFTGQFQINDDHIVFHWLEKGNSPFSGSTEDRHCRLNFGDPMVYQAVTSIVENFSLFYASMDMTGLGLSVSLVAHQGLNKKPVKASYFAISDANPFATEMNNFVFLLRRIVDYPDKNRAKTLITEHLLRIHKLIEKDTKVISNLKDKYEAKEPFTMQSFLRQKDDENSKLFREGIAVVNACLTTNSLKTVYGEDRKESIPDDRIVQVRQFYYKVDKLKNKIIDPSFQPHV